MIVKELKNFLNQFPDNMDVFVCGGKTDFEYGLLISVYVKEIEFKEDPSGETPAKDKVVILDEE